MRTLLASVAWALVGCAATQSPSTTTPVAAAAVEQPPTPTIDYTSAPPRPKITPGSGVKGKAASAANQYYGSHVSAFVDQDGGKERSGETIDGAECRGAAMQHTGWCTDTKTLILCDQNRFLEVDCTKVAPTAVCALDETGRGTVDCVTP
jgi:hypothetical protein